MTEPTFEQLQARLVPLWKSIERMNPDEQTIVVVPSLTVDFGDRRGATLQATRSTSTSARRRAAAAALLSRNVSGELGVRSA
jgi:hypothetical protein